VPSAAGEGARPLVLEGREGLLGVLRGGDNGHVGGDEITAESRTRPGPASAESFDDRGVGLAAALAHGLQAVPAAAALQLVQQLGGQDGAGGAQRVA
jgi:hypothetical protein